MNTNYLGKWPVDGEEARSKREFIKIPRNKMLHMIHGREHPVSITFFVSNDTVHMGEFVIPCGSEGPRVSEVDSHNGDAVIYVESGPIAFFLPDNGETFLVREDEAMLIPQGVRYQCINYTKKVVKGIFSIAPGI